MTSMDKELPADLKAALEDLRRIREVVDASDASHPIRLIGRPVMLFSAVYGVVAAAFGVGAQLILDRGEPVLGLSPTTVVWTLGLLAFVAGSVAKSLVFAQASRRAGFDFNVLFRRLFSAAYGRMVFGVLLMIIISCVAVALQGGAAMIVGIVTVGFGVIYVLAPTLIPFREMTWIGIAQIVLGTMATFFWLEWPFYKLAVIWGVTFVVWGAALYKRFPSYPPPGEKRKG